METRQKNILNSYLAPLRVTAHFMQWWTPKVAGKRKKYGWRGRLYQQKRASRFTSKIVRNAYNYTVRQDKCKCWEEFLQGAEEVQEATAAAGDTRTERDPNSDR